MLVRLLNAFSICTDTGKGKWNIKIASDEFESAPGRFQVSDRAPKERNDLKARYQAACGVTALATQRVAWKSYRAIPA